MQKTLSSNNHPVVSAQPRLHQSAPEIQAYGTVSHLLPLELEEPVRLEMTERLNQLLADTIMRLIGDVRHVAVGNASPIPALAARFRA